MRTLFKWTPEKVAEVKKLYVGKKWSNQEIADHFGVSLPSAKSIIKKHRFSNGKVHRFKKGQPSYNKGLKIGSHPNSAKTQFKKGHKPLNTLPIGSLSLRISANKRPYWQMKISEKEWKFLHIHIWETNFGPIPENHYVYFLDNNSLDCNPQNLGIIEASKWMNHNYNYQKIAEYLKVNSPSIKLTRNWLAGNLSQSDPELRNYLLTTKEGLQIIDTYRAQLLLRRKIVAMKEA